MADDRRDRIALDPAGHRVAVRDYPGDSWFVFNTADVQGRRLSDLPDDWTLYVPATDRDRLAEQVEELAEAQREVAEGLAWLREKAEPPYVMPEHDCAETMRLDGTCAVCGDRPLRDDPADDVEDRDDDG